MPTISKCASIVYRFGHMFFDEHLEENHIGSGQQFFLLHIYEHPGISQEELAHMIKGQRHELLKNWSRKDIFFVKVMKEIVVL